MGDGTKDGFRVPRIKVCGLQRIEDLGDALSLGVDAVGLVEHPRSPRSLLPSEAARLVEALPEGILTVAVMVDRTPEFAQGWLEASGAHCVQLCGEEEAPEWRDFPFPILRRVPVGYASERELERWEGIARAFVLDQPGAPGGTGREVHAGLAEKLARRAPCLLAGGLAADNVGRLVAAVRPAGVDASSRLERSPGKKDPGLVAEFVRAARTALEELEAAS